eukprot:scaffold32673_cov58-Phaeocystis_antarctica.AAC.3
MQNCAVLTLREGERDQRRWVWHAQHGSDGNTDRAGNSRARRNKFWAHSYACTQWHMHLHDDNAIAPRMLYATAQCAIDVTSSLVRLLTHPTLLYPDISVSDHCGLWLCRESRASTEDICHNSK